MRVLVMLEIDYDPAEVEHPSTWPWAGMHTTEKGEVSCKLLKVEDVKLPEGILPTA